jgi:hypothetical protein
MEEKLRGAVGDIRYMLMAAGGNPKLLGKFLLNWSGLGNALFRSLLRLKGAGEIPAGAEELLLQTAREYGIPPEGFSALNRFRQGEKTNPLELADSLLEPLKTLARAVDAMAGDIP